MRPSIGREDSAGGLQTTTPLNRKETSPRGSSSSSRQKPSAFFFRSEDEMEEDLKLSLPGESMFGVQSLEEVTGLSDSMQYKEEREEMGETAKNRGESGDNRMSESITSVASPSRRPVTPEMVPQCTLSHGYSYALPVDLLPRQVSTATLSLPLTPVLMQSPQSDSVAPSSPRSVCSLKSFRLSDDDSSAEDTNSQAVVEDDVEQTPTTQTQQFPQLVMPSISMPSRRAFTEKGKSIGKLRIMFAGAHGVGKTSLIRSIVQTCEDIVHVDPLPNTSSSINTTRPYVSRKASGATTLQDYPQITEISASTRAYPSWWSEMDESRILRRRKSFGEVVLERNISFVDTPGFSTDAGVNGTQEGHLVIQHVENLLQRNVSLGALSDGEVLSILSGSGGVQVDLVFYIFTGEPKPQEYELLRHLSQLTNVIPAIGKVDLLSPDELSTLKSRIASSFDAANIRLFTFNEPIQETNFQHPTAPYAISSATSNDDETMDASVLMSPDYIQPLIHSDVSYLVSKVFDPEGAAWLRHSATRKFLHWRRVASTSQTLPITSSSINSTTSPSLSAVQLSSTASIVSTPSASRIFVNRPLFPHSALQSLTSSTSPYTLARLTDHTQREDRLAQVHLARWASDLQRSLANERARYASLHQSERANWLHERLDECEAEAASEKGALARRVDIGAKHRGRRTVLDRRDPLGLLEWDDRMRGRVGTLVKVLGGAGVVGAVAVWVLRVWGRGFGAGTWGWTWWSGVNE